MNEKEKQDILSKLKDTSRSQDFTGCLKEVIDLTEQALLSKLPEGMVETLLKPHREYVATMEAEFKKASERYEKAKAWDGKEADNGEFLSFRDGLREAKLILKVVENLVKVELSPYLLTAEKAREEERERIVKLIENWDMEGTGNSVVIARKALLQALSSPVSTEKEGK